MAQASPDFSQAVLDDLYEYRQKHNSIAFLLCLLTGLFGGHRFYLGLTFSGVAMALSGGGGGLWWIFDLFRTGKMVDAFNEEQQRRQQSGEPPKALGFMGDVDPANLTTPPWADKGRGRGSLGASLVVIALLGYGLGVTSSAIGNPEAIVAVFALLAITLLGARWDALAAMPVLNEFDRWSHRLRLYYFITDPGSPWTLATRPLLGIFFAPWRAKARAEVRLYLQLGATFSAAFAVVDVVEIYADGWSASVVVGILLEFLATLVTIYAFAAPIGAILTTHLLMLKSDRTLWVLSAAAVATTLLGVATI